MCFLCSPSGVTIFMMTHPAPKRQRMLTHDDEERFVRSCAKVGDENLRDVVAHLVCTGDLFDYIHQECVPYCAGKEQHVLEACVQNVRAAVGGSLFDLVALQPSASVEAIVKMKVQNCFLVWNTFNKYNAGIVELCEQINHPEPDSAFVEFLGWVLGSTHIKYVEPYNLIDPVSFDIASGTEYEKFTFFLGHFGSVYRNLGDATPQDFTAYLKKSECHVPCEQQLCDLIKAKASEIDSLHRFVLLMNRFLAKILMTDSYTNMDVAFLMVNNSSRVTLQVVETIVNYPVMSRNPVELDAQIEFRRNRASFAGLSVSKETKNWKTFQSEEAFIFMQCNATQACEALWFNLHDAMFVNMCAPETVLEIAELIVHITNVNLSGTKLLEKLNAEVLMVDFKRFANAINFFLCPKRATLEKYMANVANVPKHRLSEYVELYLSYNDESSNDGARIRTFLNLVRLRGLYENLSRFNASDFADVGVPKQQHPQQGEEIACAFNAWLDASMGTHMVESLHRWKTNKFGEFLDFAHTFFQ